MPAGRYDRYFGGVPGSASKAQQRIHDFYGAEKGEQVFRGLTAKRAAQGKGGGMKRARRRLRSNMK